MSGVRPKRGESISLGVFVAFLMILAVTIIVLGVWLWAGVPGSGPVGPMMIVGGVVIIGVFMVAFSPKV